MTVHPSQVMTSAEGITLLQAVTEALHEEMAPRPAGGACWARTSG